MSDCTSGSECCAFCKMAYTTKAHDETINIECAVHSKRVSVHLSALYSICVTLFLWERAIAQDPIPNAVAGVVATSTTTVIVIDRNRGLVEYDLEKNSQQIVIPFNDPGIGIRQSLTSDKSQLLLPVASASLRSAPKLLNLSSKTMVLVGEERDFNTFWIDGLRFITSGTVLSDEKPIDDPELSGPLRLTVWSIEGGERPVKLKSISVGGDVIQSGGLTANGITFVRSFCGAGSERRSDFVAIDINTGRIVERRQFPEGHLNERHCEGRKEFLLFRPTMKPDDIVEQDAAFKVYGYRALAGAIRETIHPFEDVIASCTADKCPKMFRLAISKFTDEEWTFLAPFDVDPPIPKGLKTNDAAGILQFHAVNTIGGLDFSPKGDTLFAITAAGRVCAWDTKSWKLIFDSKK